MHPPIQHLRRIQYRPHNLAGVSRQTLGWPVDSSHCTSRTPCGQKALPPRHASRPGRTFGVSGCRAVRAPAGRRASRLEPGHLP